MNKLIQEIAYNASNKTGVNLMSQDQKFVAEFARMLVEACASEAAAAAYSDENAEVVRSVVEKYLP